MSDGKPRPFTPTEERIGSLLVGWMGAINARLYRLSGGKIGGTWLRGAPVLLLTTTGRKSGLPRVAPLLYLEEGADLVIVASKGGMSQHPWWYRNLEASPDVEVEIGTRRRAMRARRASDEEKKTLWPKLVAMYPDYDHYQARTTRDIPVVILSDR